MIVPTGAKQEGKPEALLRWSVPPPPRAHTEILAVVGLDVDGAIVAIRFEVRRLIRDGVLAAEFILNNKLVAAIASEVLLERETMQGDEMKKLWDQLKNGDYSGVSETALKNARVEVAESPADMGAAVKRAMARKK